jgi:hypothetical protein
MRDAPDTASLHALLVADPDAPVPARALATAVLAGEARAGSAPVAAWAARLAALCGDADPATNERRLVAALRAGALDDGPRRAALRAHLVATVRAKLDELDPALAAGWPLLGDGGAWWQRRAAPGRT